MDLEQHLLNTTALKYLREIAEESQKARDLFLASEDEKLLEVAFLLTGTFRGGGKLLICGNGGSAADAQHMAAELVGRMQKEREPFAAIALTTDTSNLTALGNDYGYEQVFARQVRALAKPNDVLFAISTSGNSKNVLEAIREAKVIGCHTVGLTGGSGGVMARSDPRLSMSHPDFLLNVTAGGNSSRIQETHIFAIHAIVDLMEQFSVKTTSDPQQPSLDT